MIEVKQGPYSLKFDKVRFEKVDEKKLKLNKIKIPVNKPFISNQDIKSVNTVLKNGWFF